MDSPETRRQMLLWITASCGIFPVQMAERLGGDRQINRNIAYGALRDGYTEWCRWVYGDRIVRGYYITAKGLAYLAEQDPDSADLLLAQHGEICNSRGDRDAVIRAAKAIGMTMAYAAGAVILPERKPALCLADGRDRLPADPDTPYYYSMYEIRAAVQEYDPRTKLRQSGMSGVIIRGSRCYCLYYIWTKRMFWRARVEAGTLAELDTLLCARGFNCDSFSTVLIGQKTDVAAKFVGPDAPWASRSSPLDTGFGSCFFVTNDKRGDRLLRLITDERRSAEFGSRILRGEYRPLEKPDRVFDAVTQDGERPVMLAYDLDLLRLRELDPAPPGFREGPIVLCLDYQADAVQKMVGGMAEVRVIREALPV